MSELKKLGDKLRKARESKGYSLREVSEKTHMSPKFLEALEEEDFSSFSSETYILGFLRNYAEFLNLDPEEIIKEYKGLRLQNSASPLEELTNISKPTLQIPQNLLKYFILALIFIGIVYLSYKIYDFIFLPTTVSYTTTIKPCDKRDIKTITLKEESLLSLLDLSNNYEFFISSLNIKFILCITKIERKENYENVKFSIDYNKKNYPIETKSGETIILTNMISELNQADQKIELSVKEVSENAIQIELLAKTKMSANKDIIVTLEILQETYLEWVADGKVYKGDFFRVGDILNLEADYRLDIKIGNGAGVRFYREGFPPRIAGTAGKIVKLSFTKISDPFDTTKFKIEEQIIIPQ